MCADIAYLYFDYTRASSPGNGLLMCVVDFLLISYMLVLSFPSTKQHYIMMDDDNMINSLFHLLYYFYYFNYYYLKLLLVCI